jgi:hypothetical protein
MYLMVRKISPYSGPDILLGCYKSLLEAQKARELYLWRYQNGEREDPWKDQVFYTVNLEQDVVILDNIPELDVPPCIEKVTIVCSMAEGFGQKVTKFHAICGSAEAIRASFSEVQKGLDGDWPEECQTRWVAVGELLSDDKDRFVLKSHIKTLKELKKNKNFRGAEKMLIDLIAYNKTQNNADGLGIDTWYYVELAKLYRTHNDYSKEIAALEDYAKQENIFGGKSKALLERLNRAKEQVAAKEL